MSEPQPEPGGTPQERGASLSLLLLCFFLSGLAALVYETAWTREFAFVFGTSDLAVATVLAAYMAGLAAGAAVAARLAHRVRRPVLVYGLLELGIALAALGVPLAIRASRALYVGVFGGLETLPEAGATPTALFYLACSFVILMVPTAMMGATLPLLARHAVRADRELGSRIGALYAANTAGAVAGVVLAAFVLLPAVGLRLTIWSAAGVNALVFAVAWALARSAGPMPAAEPAPRAGAVDRPATGAVFLVMIFLSGAVSFTYEVLWVRLLAHLIGGSVYAFATMLASFLAGIALGAAFAARLATSPRRGATGFAAAQLGIAALSWIAFVAVPWIPEVTAELQRLGASRRLGDVVVGALTLFPAALCIGATFPFAVRAVARRGADAGPASARVYAANTFGSIVGSVAAGFVVIPTLGYAGSLAACVAVNLGLAAAAAGLPERRFGGASRRGLVAVAAAGAVVLALARPAPPWRTLRTSFLNPSPAAGEVEYFGVGRAATVLLLENDGEWFLRTNGLPEARIEAPFRPHNRSLLARWLGGLPVLARPEARSMLVVGLGGGVAVETVPSSIERIHVVELEPEVVEANRSVGDRRWRDPLADPRVSVHLNDARNALLLSEMRFDAIVSQPSHPWSSGASHLYTREFFALARSRLADDGVLVQWVGLSFVDEALFRTLLATLTAEFAHVRVYRPPPGGGVLFLASDAPFDMARSTRRALAAVPDDLRWLGIEVAEDETAALLLDAEGSRALARRAAPNLDDWNQLQNRSPKILGRSLGADVERVCALHDPLARPQGPGPDALGNRFHLVRRVGVERAERVARAFEDPLDRRVAEALVARSRGQRGAARATLAEALRESPRHVEARAALLQMARVELAAGAEPTRWVAAPLTRAERAVVEGWRALGRRRPAALLAQEPALAAIPGDHPLARTAVRLRAEWRAAGTDPELAREAIGLVDRLLVGGARPRDLLLRARACATAREPAAALGSLLALAGPGSGAELRRLRGRGLAILESLPDDPSLAPLRARVRGALGGRSPAGFSEGREGPL